MTYKLNQIVEKINAPIILKTDSNEQLFEDGTALANAEFDKYYVIESISVNDDRIVVVVKENKLLNDTTWCGEEQVSFF